MTLDDDEFLPEPVRPRLHDARGAAARRTAWLRR
jgi:hypothetical protein